MTMDENTRAKYEEKIKTLLAMAKKKKNVLEYQEISDHFADLHLEEEQMDEILDALEKDYQLLIFVSKNLSWNVFQEALDGQMPDNDLNFYDMYLQLIKEDEQIYEHPDLMLFSVIELASSTCYNCILYQQPVPLEEYMPYLHKSIDGILSSYQKDSSDTSAD